MTNFAIQNNEKYISQWTLHRVRVGDIIRYPDGTESKIVSGAGYAAVCDGKLAAIIGSAAENGDTIIDSLQDAWQFAEYADGDAIPGLLQPGYVPPESWRTPA